MKRSENGYIPARGFLDSCLKPRPSFNDGSPTKQVPVAVEEGKVEMVDTLSTLFHVFFCDELGDLPLWRGRARFTSFTGQGYDGMLIFGDFMQGHHRRSIRGASDMRDWNLIRFWIVRVLMRRDGQRSRRLLRVGCPIPVMECHADDKGRELSAF